LAIVIPAQAEIHALRTRVVWIPAFAGTTRFMPLRSGNGMRVSPLAALAARAPNPSISG